MTKQRSDKPEIKPFAGPAGGWGSVRSLAEILPRERVTPDALVQLARQNKPDGFMCTSCAWPKPADHHPAEFCEEGAKATAWELTTLRTTPEFFEQYTLTELVNGLWKTGPIDTPNTPGEPGHGGLVLVDPSGNHVRTLVEGHDVVELLSVDLAPTLTRALQAGWRTVIVPTGGIGLNYMRVLLPATQRVLSHSLLNPSRAPLRACPT